MMDYIREVFKMEPLYRKMKVRTDEERFAVYHQHFFGDGNRQISAIHGGLPKKGY